MTYRKTVDSLFNAHLPNAAGILAALVNRSLGENALPEPDLLASLPSMRDWQRILLEEFQPLVAQRSYDFISKSEASWLIVGDRRRAVANELRLVIQEHGPGPGLLLLHLHQLLAGHIPIRLGSWDGASDLARPTEVLHGERGENVLSIPVRALRADVTRLAELGVAKPPALWDRRRIRSHEPDGAVCFFCSCGEINPAEVVLDLEPPRIELDRAFSFGATFAPFGNPIATPHLLAWDRAPQPRRMSLAPGSICDLLRLMIAINASTRTFLSSRYIPEWPSFDGLFNGWAGNSIVHQHFQFFVPEYSSPLARPERVARWPLARRDDILISRFDWPTPVYEIRSDSPLRTAFVAQELAVHWRFLGGGHKVPYKEFPALVPPGDSDLVPVHTQNLYAPGAGEGRVLWFIPRDRRRVDFTPKGEVRINHAGRTLALSKKNLGVLETTGTWIVDSADDFTALRGWSARAISEQMSLMLAAVAPDSGAVQAFESRLEEVLPL